MLIIVHHGNVKALLQAFFDIEAFRRLDIFQIDTTERRGYSLNGFTELFRIFLCHLNIENINTTIDFEK